MSTSITNYDGAISATPQQHGHRYGTVIRRAETSTGTPLIASYPATKSDESECPKLQQSLTAHPRQ